MGNETTYPTKEELVAGYKLRELFKQRMIEDLQRQKLTEVQIRRLKALRDFVANNIIDVKLFDKSRLHAKLYLFLTKPEERFGSPGLAVVGSSNFTAEGLTQNKELNVLLTAREEVLYLNQWFDELWDEAVEFREDLLKVIDISGVLPESPYPKVGELIDPQTLFKYLVYRWTEGRVLNLHEKDILLEFQEVGVLNATKISSHYNGVILADSVGLGKSFMAAGVIQDFLNRRYPTWIPDNKDPGVLLILPPSIISQWEELLIGRMDKGVREALHKGEKIRRRSDYFLKENFKRLVLDQNNHRIYEIYDESGEKLLGKIAFLSLGVFQSYNLNTRDDEKKRKAEQELKKFAEEYDLFVIDEAHKYRNSNTNRWRAVRKLQKKSDNFQNRFMLLTATPLNNSIDDIYNLIRLFTDETFAPFRVKGIPITDLINRYRSLKRELERKDDDGIRKELKKVAAEIKSKILDEVMVLRTRKYIMEQFKDLKVDGKQLVFKDPRPYSLNPSPFYTKSYRRLVDLIARKLDCILFEYTKLYGTRFVVFEEEGIGEEDEGKGQRRYIEIADLFKLLLGKRLESGIYPFETTLRRIYEKEKIFYEAFRHKMDTILSEDALKDLIKEVVEGAKIKKELDEIREDYNVEEAEGETWFDRVIKILIEYAEELKEDGRDYADLELLRLGLKKVISNLENDLRIMDEILEELDKLKVKREDGKGESFWANLTQKQDRLLHEKIGTYKVLGFIPKKEEDVVDLPIFSYHNDPKLESLKQILGNPSFKSESLRDIPTLNRRKVLIFTQYRDTAYYLFHNLKEWAEREVNLFTWLKDGERIKIGLVTGDTETSTKINYIKRFAPQANSGFDEVERYGELEILISTDALSEGVNLQDADAVINYDLPWNPMIIVQRVGRVNRIGNEKDVYVINFVPSDEVEVIVGVLSKLKEKIRDITLVVGKETKILGPEEEISVETFGERIKDISKLSMTDLEQYGMSEDFKQFTGKIPQEQLDEYRLLNIIQYDLGYTDKDFEDVIDMGDGPYYSFIQGEDKIISIYEFYRGNYRIMKKIISINPETHEISYETPIVLLDLIKRGQRSPERIENAIENLERLKERTEDLVEDLKERSQQEQRGFLSNLYDAMDILEDEVQNEDELYEKYIYIMNVLPFLNPQNYASTIKNLLLKENCIEVSTSNRITIRDVRSAIIHIEKLFRENGLSEMDFSFFVKHLGWYYERED